MSVKPWCECTGGKKKAGFTKATDGWWVCAQCMKPTILTLNDCDICDCKFRGVRQFLKIAYTCEDCESRM